MTRDRSDVPLPGLEQLDPEWAASLPSGMSALESSVRRTLAALSEDEKLAEHDAGRTALAVELARIIAVKTHTGKLSTVSNDARLLLELLDSLAGDEGDSGLDARLAEKMGEWEAALEAMAEEHAAP